MICAILEAELSPFAARAAVARSASGESSAARPAAVGTESPDGPENDGGDHVDLAAECPQCGREHQPRENAVPCLSCRRLTFDVHAVCSRCAEGVAP